MQYLIPIQIVQLDESKSFLEILAEKNKMNLAVSTKHENIILLSDSQPTMQEAFMAVYAAVHEKSYPEFFDFLSGSANNEFIHERTKQLFKCYSPKKLKAEKTEENKLNLEGACKTIHHNEVKDYFYKKTLVNLQNHIDI